MFVLRSKLSGYFFKDFGVWTPDPSKAVGFGDEWAARAFVRNEHVEDVQVIAPEIVAPEFNIAA